MASKRPAVVRYTQEEFKKLACQCLWFCLAKNANKKKIKKDKIIEYCLDKDKKQLHEIMQCVDHLLKSKFGLRLETAHEDGYFIIQNVKSAPVPPAVGKDDDAKEKHVLWLVIAAIYLNNGQMEEREMTSFLQLSGLIEAEVAMLQTASQFSQSSNSGRRGINTNLTMGEQNEAAVKYFDKLLKKTFVQQLYLEYKPTPGATKVVSQNSRFGTEQVFTFGPRTKACLDEENLKKYIDVLRN